MDEKTKTGVLALLIALCLFGACGGVLWLASLRPRGERATAPEGKTPARAGPQKAEEPGPYPECAACLEYLKKRAHDPDSLRVVEWLGRHEHTVRGEPWVAVTVRVRARNQLGGWTNQVRAFNLRAGVVMTAGEGADPLPIPE
jgi:hypothetical protein